MPRPKNPYPGVTRVTDRHGKVRWRFRRKGFSCYIQGAFGSAEFRASYEAATNEARTPAPYSAETHGTLSWLIEHYLRSPKHKNKSDTTRRVLRRELDWLRSVAGSLPVASFRVRHIEALMAKKDGPAAANKVRKNLSLLFNYALKQEVEGVTGNPARAADRMEESEDGFHTWTEGEMARFLEHHGAGTKARLVFLLALNTGASRADIARLTWGNVKGGKIAYRRGKTGVAGEYTILPELAEELVHCPRDVMLLVHHGEGRAYKPETLGNWFKDQCRAAGLAHCTLHGIRKGQATRIVNWGGTPDEVMAYLAHKTNAEGVTYTKKANRGRLADSALSRLGNVQPAPKVGQAKPKNGAKS
ncbi:integrase [Mameliella alba]|uniref:tyrosine-type recombinase/integrase n=1 Tax=Mameliella alba TaxID=561184 RepID=UPI000B533EE1|nr:integrase [Mameliella alba]